MSNIWTPMPHFRGGRALLSVFKLGILTMLCPVLLSACGESTPSGYSGSNNSDTLKPIAAPPGADEQPTLAGQTGTPKTPDGLPVLSAKGTKTALFSSEMSNEASRIERLENAVQELRNDFDSMAPAIVRLVSIEKDLQNLITQLDMLTSGGAPAPIPSIEESALDVAEPIQPADVPLPPAPTDALPSNDPLPIAPTPDPAQVPAQDPVPPAAAVAPAPPAAAPTPPPAPTATAANTVTAVRIGEHPGKIRIVLDIKGKTAYTADLDNGEKILVIELPDAAWSAQTQQTFPASHPLLASYRTEPQGQGTMLILQLKKASSIAYKSAPADAASGTSKIIIDLTK